MINLAVADRDAVQQGLAPCPRCCAIYDTEGQLGEHLMREHVMGEARARREAHEASTGITRDVDGACVGCKRPPDVEHTQYCYVARRAERLGYRVTRARAVWRGVRS